MHIYLFSEGYDLGDNEYLHLDPRNLISYIHTLYKIRSKIHYFQTSNDLMVLLFYSFNIGVWFL